MFNFDILCLRRSIFIPKKAWIQDSSGKNELHRMGIEMTLEIG